MSPKKILSLVMAGVLAVQPLLATASDLDQAFQSLVGPGSAATVNDPGRFSSAARSGVMLGGFEMRVPRNANAPTLLSATPPRINAGCNGISAHFGGFSFISGEEFTNLLKQIASGAALGFVASLVMKSLCPMCEAVVQELKSAAQAAARLAKDSCSIGEEFGRAFMDGMSSQGSGLNTCDKITTAAGASSDSLDSAASLCSTLTQAARTMNEWADRYPAGDGSTPGGQNEASRAAFECSQGLGNVTWNRLTSMDSEGIFGSVGDDANVRRLMLMNLMGADLRVSGDHDRVGCEAVAGGPPVVLSESKEQHYCKPPLDTRTITGIFMCGAPGAGGVPATTTRRVQEYCATFAAGAVGGGAAGETQVWTCDGGFTACPYLRLVPAREVFRGTGFLHRINALLHEASRRVRDSDPAGFNDDVGRQIIALVNAAPYPLYQAINAAAVYPAAANDLLDAMSVLVAEQFTHALFEEMLRLQGRTSNENTCITRPQATEILDFISSLRTQNANRLALIAQNFTVQEGMAEQIRHINLAVQRQVLSNDLLATGQLSDSLNRALSPTGASTPVPAGQ